MGKKWIIAEKINDEFIAKFPEIEPVVLQLLYNRGLESQDKIDRFLGPDYLTDQHDPYLFNDMKKAVEIIMGAIKDGKKIVVYGDYDADGVSSTALMYLSLKRMGAKDLAVYIPNRMSEGYGINMEAVEEMVRNKVDLVISVDCGVTAVAEVKLARDKRMKVVITDHHLTGEEVPEAEAIICPTVKNEKYPFKQLAGVGVAFKLAQALLREGENNEAFEKWLLDIVAIGTVADVVPLLGENRTLVKWGLLVLNKTQRLGLVELIEGASLKRPLGTYNIGFQIAPRLNAAGRMDHANTAYELLITEDEAEAIAIVNDLNEKNSLRQKATEGMMKISLEQIGWPGDKDKILFSCYDSWSAGLVGLVAGRLCDRFHRPVIVMGKTGEKYIGSGRSIVEFDITSALGECSEYLEEYGGHSQACGLTIMGEEKYIKFQEKIRKVAEKELEGVKLLPALEIEAEIGLEEANWELVDSLDKFEPFGEGNLEPLFLTRNLEIYDIVTMGGNKQHLRLDLAGGAGPKKFVGFNLVEKWIDKLEKGGKADVVYQVGVNEWNGNRDIEFKIVDLKVNK